jgi:hypothetical protein
MKSKTPTPSEKTDIETLLASVDQQLLVRLLDSLILEQAPALGDEAPAPEATT